ncbi:zinc finger BED domain-containing protein 5-like [Homarus americanus]|uniref:zinc finger BED domain-containing protein 5-like n=1 Tax=Homarus americanus TaxID=6706 RepID=UPI001C46E56D|nr:zinc finger BED domain-containing protein 5-like [Homarus americanus]
MTEEVDARLSAEITRHHETLKKEFAQYFPDIEEMNLGLTLEMKFDSGVKELYKKFSVQIFWAQVIDFYSKIGKLALKSLLPFSSIYLCESGFSTLKKKLERRVDALCTIHNCSRIDMLVRKKQAQSSPI